MKNYALVKAIAIVLCAACLMAAAFSGGGLVMLAAMNLGENKSPAQWYQEDIQRDVNADAGNLVARYAARQAPVIDDEMLNSYYGYVDRVVSRREMNYEIYNSQGTLVESARNVAGQLREYRSTVKKGQIDCTILLAPPVHVKNSEDLDQEVEKLRELAVPEENIHAGEDDVDVRDGVNGFTLYKVRYIPLGEDYTVVIHAAPQKYDSSADAKLIELADVVWRHQTQVMILLGVSLALFGALAVYLCMAAGRRPGSEEVRPGGLNCLPLDLYFCLAACLAVVYVMIGVEGVRYLLGQGNTILIAYYGYGAYACCLAFVGFCFACAAQFKTKGHYWWHHSVTGLCWRAALRCWRFGWKCLGWCYHVLWAVALPVLQWTLGMLKKLWRFAQGLWKKLRHLLAKTYGLLPLTWQWLLTGGVLALSLLLAIADRNEFWITVICAAGAAAILYGANVFGTLLDAAKRMRSGDLNVQVDDKIMLGAFKAFAGELNGLNEVVQIAAQKQMRSERMRTELITNVSHDIKTPLTSIINYVDLLQKPHTEEEGEKYLEVLSRQSGRMKKLIDDLIELSKASTGNIPVNIGRIDAVEAVNQALGEFADKLSAAELLPKFVQPENPVFIRADGRLLWRAMSNLLSNAVKYALPGTRLYVDMVAVDGKVCISFKNISRDPLNISAEELMERFVRGEASRNQEGSGLGLNIAQSMMELQHGSLELLVDGDLFKATMIFPQEIGE